MRTNKSTPVRKIYKYRLALKRIAVYTLILLSVFLAAYMVNRFLIRNDYREIIYADGSTVLTSRNTPLPQEILVISFLFFWLIGSLITAWHTLAKQNRPIVRIHSKEQLQKIILKRYQKAFVSAAFLYTLILGLLAAMIFLIQRSRIWYETDPFFALLKFLKDLSPFAGVALWLGGIAWLLYRQWRQSATDVVGLIGSIEQMQAEQENMMIHVPDTLPEVQPIVQDLYDRAQESRRVAKEAEQRKNELIAYLAHDLRTPLTSMIGYLSLLTEQPDMPQEQKAKYCGIALDKAIRLESLIAQFFEISRYNMNGMALKKKQFDLKYLLVQLADEFYPTLEQPGKTIVLDAPDELCIQGDAEKLARAFTNILRNAVTYSYPESVIQITASQTNAQTRVSIQNTGNTIPEHQLKTIFQKLTRLDNARGSDTGGAGLGLAIAQEIVLLHGGSISAESREEITTFLVLLPNALN